MSLQKIQRVHCLGIGGIGVSAVARILKARGLTVSGSELHPSLITAELGREQIQILPESSANITRDIDLVIYSDACPEEHAERQAAAQLGVRQVNFSEVLGWLMKEYKTGVAIAGTNGKSTTTALLGQIMIDGGLEPTVVVGSRVPGFQGNVRIGKGNYFVTEADDYRDHFLQLHPQVLTITNIELDHPDYFPDLKAVTHSFSALAQQTALDGQLIINDDDPVSRTHFADDQRHSSFGFSEGAMLFAAHWRQIPGWQEWQMIWNKKDLGKWRLPLPGKFNVANALAAAATALHFNIAPEIIAQRLEKFTGIWRRFEILNPGATVTVISDYAHHPTSIQGILQGAKNFYPGRRIIAVFQPHHHHRLTGLFQDFAKSFSAADELILTEVYQVAGREESREIMKTGQDLFKEVRHSRKYFASDLSSAATQVKSLAKAGDVVMIIGAGDIWEIAAPLAEYYAK